ncbi:transmembrane adaptor Erv26-domain-containing protein [Suillus fuscotomentosus]|uniref:Transmembrane adaptor Erv26-domain-containing protein n=1 Tax=Suillus fuscotomentosus TaxID=1912939 RepID=A0AAD4EJ12_9AGAM|nr:transmembrane adaptor Erv26-domain-containing protein [Suillus fuscotomentosus]KAG1906981.1 transmembrane adaptor Erv26-domain-containing protein [Suillus fuscotomentosus]
MSLLHYLSYAAMVAALAFMTLSLASGLLYISELIEEHSRLAKIIGQRGTYAIIVLHIALYISDSLPLARTLFSIVCHVVYLQNFSSTWPLISLSSLSFIASCILAISDHFIWFFYFSHLTREARQVSYLYRTPMHSTVPGFSDIATFFGVCVWLVPLFLFLSLSANDHALPTSSGIPSTPTASFRTLGPHSNSSLFKAMFRFIPFLPKAFRREATDGLIAPHTPNHTRQESSPAPSSPTVYHVPLHTPGGVHAVAGTGVLPPNRFSLGSPPRRASQVPTRVTVDSGSATLTARRNKLD